MNTYTSKMLKVLDNIEIPTALKASSPAKISLSANNAFSLPAGPEFSCPGATKACEDCYAMKKRHIFPAVQKAFGGNWEFLEDLRKKKNTKKAVKAILDIIPKKAEIFRIHESGDYYSQWYVNVWAEVIKRRPDVRFWAYTRSFKYNYSKLTRRPNFTLWASTDEYNVKQARQFVRRYKKSGVKHAYGPYPHRKRRPMNTVVCPATNGRIKLEGACEKCMLCVVKKRISKNILFRAH